MTGGDFPRRPDHQRRHPSRRHLAAYNQGLGRSAERRSARGVGGRVVGRRRVHAQSSCECCGCRVAVGQFVFEVLPGVCGAEDGHLLVCTDCRGPW
jgi:hypothetical protein